MAKRERPTAIDREEYEDCRNILRMLVRIREDQQAQRKAMDNRLARKADGTEQDRENLSRRVFTADAAGLFVQFSDSSRAQEELAEKEMLKVLRKIPVYNHFLEGVKGCGTIASAHIISAFDIYKADTVSKMWQYAGLNPGMVVGKKRVKQGDEDVIVTTDKLIRGDHLEAGFISPFNKTLRVALRGVMCDGFIKAQNVYCMNFYYPYKERLANSSNSVPDGKGGTLKAWKDVSAGHRDGAAKRYMLKMFIKDLYAAWRPMHGLSVREPYQEQYLGHKHK